MRKAVRFGASLGAVALVLVVYGTALHVNNTTVALTLLLVILGISTKWGLAEASVASVVASLGFNYFFLEPVGTFTIQDPQNLVALLVFLITAITTSQLSARARRQAAEAEARRIDIERLYGLVQAMMPGGSARKTVREFVNRVVQVFGCDAAAFYYLPGDEIVRSGPESNAVSDHELQAAAEVADVCVQPDRAVATAPVRLGGRPLGSLALMGPLPSEQMVRAIANLVAITIEKARALEEAGHAEAARQSEVLKSALLDALAHDIKTPLTSIKAAATSLLGEAAGAQRELLTIIDEEADRLNRLAAETIEMARIEAGKLHLEKQPVNLDEMIAGALAQLGPESSKRVTVKMPDGLPPVDADPEFAGQVVKQFVENALKYSPAGSPIAVTAVPKGGKIVIGVADSGSGIAETERARIFEKFFRGRQHRFETQGTGMGLAIAKGIVEAHGERIWVESEPGQGSVFYFTLAVSGGGPQK
jgi:two-component system, OmpR family, sensor histidine kinase KdpD